MHQCPGCHEYVVVVSKSETKPPIMYEVSKDKKRHNCSAFKNLKKDIKSMPFECNDDQDHFDFGRYVNES